MNGSATSDPVIIIAAARTGSRLLRRIVALHRGMIEIPHDINYVWRHDSMRCADDALTADAAGPMVHRFVRDYFTRFARRAGGGRVVEKTVGNSLRVAYVRPIFPEARLIHLVRDGRDVVASAYRQWQAPLRWRELWPKVQTFPWWSARLYAGRYAGHYLGRWLRRERGLRSWGPVYPGIAADVRNLSLHEVCARQWSMCVEASWRELQAVPRDLWLQVRYEDLVRQPIATADRLARFLSLEATQDRDRFLAESVRVGSVGKWRDELTDAELARVMPLLEPQQTVLGYAE